MEVLFLSVKVLHGNDKEKEAHGGEIIKVTSTDNLKEMLEMYISLITSLA